MYSLGATDTTLGERTRILSSRGSSSEWRARRRQIGSPACYLVPRQATFARIEISRSSSLSLWRLRQAM